MQKRGTSFEAISPILIDQKMKIQLGAYGFGSMPVIYNNRLQSKVIDLENAMNCSISDLEIRSNGNALACIYIAGATSDGIIIENCFIHHAQNGILSVGVNGSTTVRYNKISNNTLGLNTDAAFNQIYYNQLVKNSTAIRILNNRKADVINNTFYGNSTFSIESLQNTIVKSLNNIFFLDASSTKVYKLRGLTTSNYNIFNIEKPGFLNGYSTLQLWRKNSGQDKNSKVADPKFVNASNSDFRIKTGSPCINRASDVNLHRDYFGTEVPQGGIPDVGFFELITSIADNGQAPGIAQIISYDSAMVLNNNIQITAYPNPTAGIVHIKVNKAEDTPIGVRVIDLYGKQIYSIEDSYDSEIEINMENQLTGTYFALVSVNGQTISKKLLVQK